MLQITIHDAAGAVSVRKVPRGTLLLHALGGGVEAPCGGHGRCGKCRVTVQGALSSPDPRETSLLGAAALRRGVRLACLTTVEGDCTVTLGADRAVRVIRSDGTMPAFAPEPIFEKYGAAVDIGTTTLAARLYDRTGALLAQAAAPNPQRIYGADVITRTEKSLAGERESLARCIRDGIDSLLRKMSAQAGIPPEAVDTVVLTGNTAMLYLLRELDVHDIALAPFQARHRFGEYLPAAALPQEMPTPSKAGPAAVAQQEMVPSDRRAISPLVPTSASRAGPRAWRISQASRPQVMSAPT